MDAPGRVYLLDASIYIFRAYFAVRGDWQAANGLPTNAVAGYAGFLARLLAQARPARVVTAFDESLGSGFRHAIHPGYKASRALPDEALAFQLESCRRLTRLLGIDDLASAEFEADDLIASAAHHARAAGIACTVLSRDKDLGQVLCGAEDAWWDFPDEAPLSIAQWSERNGIRPQQVPELLALTGDAIDDIPGVPGIGRRTALDLLAEYADVEAVLANTAAIAASTRRGAARTARLLDAHADTVRLARRLTGLRTDALPAAPRFERAVVDADALAGCVRELGLGERLLARLLPAAGKAA
jgi:5'-3' exonuclease